MTTLPERLRWARVASGLSARGLSERAELAKSHVALIESGGKPDVSAETVSKLASALGVSMDWLFAGSGEAPTETAIAEHVGRPKAGDTGSHPVADVEKAG